VKQNQDKNLIAYCGIFCGICPMHTGKIADLSRDLRKELRANRFDLTADVFSKISFFKVYRNYKQCYEVLGAMVRLRCKRACRAGGGPPFCHIRKCGQKKGVEGCWQCVEFEKCPKLDFLKQGHGNAIFKNLRILKKQGTAKFLQGKQYWYAK